MTTSPVEGAAAGGGDGVSPAAREGSTRWSRAGLAGATACAVAIALAVTMGQGLLAASFLIGDVPVQLTVRGADVDGLGKFGSTEATSSGEAKVLIASGEHVTIDGLCATLDMRPPIGPGFTIMASAPAARAVDLVLDTERFDGDAHATGIVIGRDAASLTRGVIDGPAGGAGLQADSFTLTDGTASALAVEALTFSLEGLAVSMHAAGTRCSP